MNEVYHKKRQSDQMYLISLYHLELWRWIALIMNDLIAPSENASFISNQTTIYILQLCGIDGKRLRLMYEGIACPGLNECVLMKTSTYRNIHVTPNFERT